jgi:gliding motility-associated-like protein
LAAMSDEGCSGSTSSVAVKVYKRLVIPNTFTPNGDGVNDLWNVTALETYPKASVNVYNRYGQQVYGSTSYMKGWDGRCNGSDVPVGVYYYIIDLHNGETAVSGFLTVLR